MERKISFLHCLSWPRTRRSRAPRLSHRFLRPKPRSRCSDGHELLLRAAREQPGLARYLRDEGLARVEPLDRP